MIMQKLTFTKFNEIWRVYWKRRNKHNQLLCDCLSRFLAIRDCLGPENLVFAVFGNNVKIHISLQKIDFLIPSIVLRPYN